MYFRFRRGSCSISIRPVVKENHLYKKKKNNKSNKRTTSATFKITGRLKHTIYAGWCEQSRTFGADFGWSFVGLADGNG